MGRASREQAERNRALVVATASRLFLERGVENVSIADIMSEAGLTPGAFTKQFESKAALIDEVFQLAFQHSTGAWEKLMTPKKASGLPGLTALVQHYFKRKPAERTCPMLAFGSPVCYWPSDAKATGTYGDGAEGLFNQFREEALKTPRSNNSEPLSEADAMLLFAAMVGAGFLARAAGEKPWIRAVQSAVLEAFPAPDLEQAENA